MAEKYITEEQRAGCQKVADAFAELYELTDVVVADAGRFGFVRLQWFSEGEGFDSAMAFSDSGELFEELWRIWYEHEVRMSGVPERTIMDILAGIREPELGVVCRIADGLGICVHELRADEEQYAISVQKDTLAKLIVVSEINGVELEELIHTILEKGIEENGFYE